MEDVSDDTVQEIFKFFEHFEQILCDFKVIYYFFPVHLLEVSGNGVLFVLIVFEEYFHIFCIYVDKKHETTRRIELPRVDFKLINRQSS